MVTRRIQRLTAARKRRPRFGPPGAGLTLVFAILVLVALFSHRVVRVPAGALPQPATAPSITPLPQKTLSAEPPPPVMEAVTGCPSGCDQPRAGCEIKGNISFRTGEKIYHLPGQQYYDKTVIEPAQGERWFCTEAEALSNDWRKSKR
jgi:hypothetical protein